MISWPAPPGGLSTEASWFRKLLMACRQTEILPGVGYRVKETSNGRILDILKQPVPSFTQVPGMHPFRIYKPNPLPPDGTAVTTFDSNGAQVAAVVNSTVPTDAGFTNGGTWAVTPPPVNPTTDAWRFWNVRTGLVEVRPWFSVIQLFTDVGQLQGNYSEWDFVRSGTDGVYPQGWHDEFDDPRSLASYTTDTGFLDRPLRHHWSILGRISNS